jgi:hypothetical protein
MVSSYQADWKQVAGYFDGDGCIIMRIGKFVLIFYLHLGRRLLGTARTIASFVNGGESRIRGPYDLPGQDAHSFRITRMREVLSIAEKIAPWTFKKRRELQVVIDYYRNVITGDAAAKIMNEQFLSRCRSGRIVEVSLPYTRDDGKRLARGRLGLSDKQLDEIRSLYLSSDVSSYELAIRYGVSDTTIRNIAKRRCNH